MYVIDTVKFSRACGPKISHKGFLCSDDMHASIVGYLIDSVDKFVRESVVVSLEFVRLQVSKTQI